MKDTTNIKSSATIGPYRVAILKSGHLWISPQNEMQGALLLRKDEAKHLQWFLNGKLPPFNANNSSSFLESIKET